MALLDKLGQAAEGALLDKLGQAIEVDFLTDRRVRLLSLGGLLGFVLFAVLTLLCVGHLGTQALVPVCFLMLAWLLVIASAFLWYVRGQARLVDAAIARIRAFLDGDQAARIDCDEEGDLYRLFHEINKLAAILSAHAENEARARSFLKNTLSDISHQLKTPLATLGIYNGIMQDETNDLATVREFSVLSEQELDRIAALVKNLLTIARLDAGTLVFTKSPLDLQEMLAEVTGPFAVQAGQEGKLLRVECASGVTFSCDGVWMREALTNIVKNAFDHTTAGCTITVCGRQFGQIVQITVRDDGSGIHPEDLPHIFKRFYRSRFSQDTQGVGLGLPLAKAIIEAHSGSIEVESILGEGTTFTINFLIPTTL